MKRATTEQIDTLYEKTKALVAEQQVTLWNNLFEPLPPVPLKGVEGAYATIEELFTQRIEAGKRKLRFSPYSYIVAGQRPQFHSAAFGQNAGTGAKWLKRILEWDLDIEKRARLVEKHGTAEQNTRFNQRVNDCHAEFRASFALGWNELHSKVRGVWEKDDEREDAEGVFLIKFPDEVPDALK